MMQLNVQPTLVTELTGEFGSISETRGKNTYKITFYDYGYVALKNGNSIRVENVPPTIGKKLMSQGRNMGWICE
jgi:hypothetical protein